MELEGPAIAAQLMLDVPHVVENPRLTFRVVRSSVHPQRLAVDVEGTIQLAEVLVGHPQISERHALADGESARARERERFLESRDRLFRVAGARIQDALAIEVHSIARRGCRWPVRWTAPLRTRGKPAVLSPRRS